MMRAPHGPCRKAVYTILLTCDLSPLEIFIVIDPTHEDLCSSCNNKLPLRNRNGTVVLWQHLLVFQGFDVFLQVLVDFVS